VACGSNSLKEVGFGTEKIEEELATILPTANAARMDLDSTRKKDAYGKLIERFAHGDLNVLIGTQMVTKGLDFEDVQLVAIMNADSLLHYPDFRAQERAYQLMEQVAGRAGRRNQRGIVAIQTYRPSHHIIDFVVNHAYKAMVAQQMDERKVFNYPPYCRLIHISLRHKDSRTVSDAADYFAAALRQMLAERVLGPEFPPVSRLRSVYHKNILIKLDKNLSAAKVKQMLLQAAQHIFTQAPYKSVRVVYDVDPY
jgi:primosomal protein N' (replication factor Y)